MSIRTAPRAGYHGIGQLRSKATIQGPNGGRIEVPKNSSRHVRLVVEKAQKAGELTLSRKFAREVGPGVRSHDVYIDDLDRLADLAPACRRQASHPTISLGKKKLLDLCIMSTRNPQTPAILVRTELASWQNPRQRLCKTRTEFLNTSNVNFELFDKVSERNWVSPPAKKIRREDSKARVHGSGCHGNFKFCRLTDRVLAAPNSADRQRCGAAARRQNVTTDRLDCAV